MDRAEFDRFADEYEATHARNVRVSGEAPEFFARYKIEDVARLWAGAPAARILDFGAGVGGSVPHWQRSFPAAAGDGNDVGSEAYLSTGDEGSGRLL